MAAPHATPTRDDYLDCFESAYRRQGPVDLALFLPDPAEPVYREVLLELARIDLEFSWERGQPTPLEVYQVRFPDLFGCPEALAALAFEEYRLRCQAGEQPLAGDYARRFGIDTIGWPQPTSPTPPPVPPSVVARSGDRATTGSGDRATTGSGDRATTGADPHSVVARSGDRATSRSGDRATTGSGDRATTRAGDRATTGADPPEVGEQFCGFQLLRELGRGAFARVFLARQDDLAQRPVVLKISTQLFEEPQALALLQHTHIVPLYSFHQRLPFQAVCMPYLGSTTLAHVLRELRSRPGLPTGCADLLAAVVAKPDDPGREAGSPSPACVQARKRPESLSYVEAVLALGARLADGLAHAHERGILHCDLKPANVLLTPAGQPLLLDFNLAQNTGRDGARTALVGGTLPYMAPEHLQAFTGQSQKLDGRCDVYGLGMILFELLTLRLPVAIPPAPLPGVLAQLRQQHLGPPPCLRPLNKAISPATEAIVRRCLEPDPRRRYQTAAELREDLERQLQHQPLRHAAEPLREQAAKWLRRHPRLTSSASVAGLATALLLALLLVLAGYHRHLKDLETRESARRFRNELRTVQFVFLTNRTSDPIQLERGVKRCRRLLDRYKVLEDPGWLRSAALRSLPEGEREQLGEEVGDLLLLWARVCRSQADRQGSLDERTSLFQLALNLNQRAESCYPAERSPCVLWRQRVEFLGALGRVAEVPHWQERANVAVPETPRDLSLLAGEHSFQGQFEEALPLLQRAVRLDPRDFHHWFDLGLCQEQVGHDLQAEACFSTCIALAPEFAPLYFRRGLVLLRLGQFDSARDDFDRMLHDQPEMAEARVNRALAYRGLGRHAEALADLTWALEAGTPYTRLYLIRAQVRADLGDAAGARRDREEGLRRQPRDEQSFLARGLARLDSDPQGALADFDEALHLNPHSRFALRNKAHVLGERLGRLPEALAALDQLLRLDPVDSAACASRAVLLARRGLRDEAHRQAEACLARDARPAILYQLAGVYALTSRSRPDDHSRALQLLELALCQGYGWNLIDRDPDLELLRGKAAFQVLIEKMRPRPDSKVPASHRFGG